MNDYYVPDDAPDLHDGEGRSRLLHVKDEVLKSSVHVGFGQGKCVLNVFGRS